MILNVEKAKKTYLAENMNKKEVASWAGLWSSHANV